MYQGKKFPCSLCFNALEIRTSKKEKPYCVCNICGVQFFIRGKEGIKRFEKLLDAQGKHLLAIPGEVGGGNSIEAISICNRLEALKAKLQEIQESKGFIFVDKDIEKTERIVKLDIEALSHRLDTLWKESKHSS